MKPTNYIVMDGNEAAAKIAYKTNEVCIIYPITPASSMGELSDQWAAEGKPNVWNTVPHAIEMQSEAGAVGAIHGALQTGALATTFTASQGLLLMIPDMFRIAAELTPTVFHVASRTVAYQGMSIYCDHSDVMTTRTTGFALLCSSNVQEVQDMALITQAAALESRVPFVHFFDGFRTSHEISKIEHLSNEQIIKMIDDNLIIDHRNQKMTPDKPSTRGVIYDSDIFFQVRETMNPFYDKMPGIVEKVMQKFNEVTGRKYNLIDYFGHPQAETIMILMGSGAETARETVEYLQKQNEKVGVLQIHLFQPFPKKHFLEALPKTCKAIAVLDRTKECGAGGEPLYQKISTAVMEAFADGSLPTTKLPKIIGGRFGITGKEFTPAMVKTIFEELKKDKPKNNFTIGIDDDVTHTNLTYNDNFDIEPANVVRAIFYGLGADGTVSANKNTMKIIGEETDYYVQGYFIYDAKKSGSKTISHLRFGPEKIRSTYLICSANFVGCHQFSFIEKLDVLENAANGATFLLNSPYSAEEIWDELPRPMQETIINKQIKFYIIDAYKIAKETGMGSRINTIMQTGFFALSNVLPYDEAITKIKESIRKTYATKGEDVLKKNFEAVDKTLKQLHEVKIPNKATTIKEFTPMVSANAPKFVKDIEGKMLAGHGNELPVSAIPIEGYYPTDTTRWEKRNISPNSPVWNSDLCIQCGRCSIVCPHAVIRAKQCSDKDLEKAPTSFKSAKLRGKNASEDSRFILQTYPEDCTGCGLCVEACPVKEKAIDLAPNKSFLEAERHNVEFFETLPYEEKTPTNTSSTQGVQYLQPLFEFSGACAGCGEAPYVKLITQLFGDRMIVGNACGCSSVYGGNLPTSPWATDKEGRGVAWSSSLFEDNAEFALGFRLTEDKHNQYAVELLQKLASELDENLAKAIIDAKQNTDEEINEQRERVKELQNKLTKLKNPLAKQLASVAEHLVKRSIWAFGGDGWAYDIGYGGLDHVVAGKQNVNLLVLDTEVYSNTGGQASKATPRASVVKFAYHGKQTAKKDLGLMAMTYGTAYICSIALGANPAQAIKAIKEAEAYDGPSVIIAYSHCIAHGIDMRKGMNQQMLAVKSGHWPLYRYNPERTKEGLNPFQLDSQKPSIPFAEYAKNENRYQILTKTNPEHAQQLMELAQGDVDRRRQEYEGLAKKTKKET
jgi:pyruvate-ferredoxin/flavodoxin oxidoreductase